jgi:hypothetical protein
MNLKFQLFTALFFGTVFITLAQETDSVAVSEEKTVYDFVIINSKYQNAFAFMGRDFGLSIPFVSSDVMYYFSSGLYLNASAFKFFQDGVPWQYSLTAGYAKDITEKTDFDVSYSQFIVADESSVTGIQNLAFLQGTFGWEWGPVYSSVQGQFLFNEELDYFLNFHSSRYFEFDKKLFKTFTVSFEPKLSLLVGTGRFYLMGGYEFTPNELDDMNKFKLQSLEFMLPLTLTVGYFDFEFQTRYVRPLNVPEFDSSQGRFLFGGEVSYAIPVKRKKRP